MARGPHLSELAAEWQALGAKPQHVRRIFLAWAGLAPWEARKGELSKGRGRGAARHQGAS